MPHHSPGEAGPRPHSLSALRSHAASAALVHLERRNGTGSGVSPWGKCAALKGLLRVTRCHLGHPVGALGRDIHLVIPAQAGTQTEQANVVALRRHCFLGWAPAFAGVKGGGLDGAETPPSRLRRSTSTFVAVTKIGEDLRHRAIASFRFHR